MSERGPLSDDENNKVESKREFFPVHHGNKKDKMDKAEKTEFILSLDSISDEGKKSP